MRAGWVVWGLVRVFEVGQPYYFSFRVEQLQDWLGVGANDGGLCLIGEPVGIGMLKSRSVSRGGHC